MLTLSDRTAVAAAAMLAAAAYLLLTPMGYAASVSVRQTGDGNVSVRSVETNGQSNVSVRVNGQEMNWNSDTDARTFSTNTVNDGNVRVWSTPNSTVRIWQEPTVQQWNDDTYRSSLFNDSYCNSLTGVRSGPCLRGMQRAQVQASLDAYRAWYRRWVQSMRSEVAGYSSRGWNPSIQIQQQMQTMPWSWRMRDRDWQSGMRSGVYWY